MSYCRVSAIKFLGHGRRHENHKHLFGQWQKSFSRRSICFKLNRYSFLKHYAQFIECVVILPMRFVKYIKQLRPAVYLIAVNSFSSSVFIRHESALSFPYFFLSRVTSAWHFNIFLMGLEFPNGLFFEWTCLRLHIINNIKSWSWLGTGWARRS